MSKELFEKSAVVDGLKFQVQLPPNHPGCWLEIQDPWALDTKVFIYVGLGQA